MIGIKNKKIFIQFSDDSTYLGSVFLYKDRSHDPSYHCLDTNSLLYYLHGTIFIKPQDCEFIYTTTSVVKFCDMTDEEYKAYIRDKNINSIIS